MFSHLRQDPQTGEWVIQTNDAHSHGVAKLAAEFAADFDMEQLGRILGLLHDKGKETEAFQRHIRFTSGYDTSVRPSGDTTHALRGALCATRLYPSLSMLLALPIAGHHRGLYDIEEFKDLLRDLMNNKDLERPKCDLSPTPPPSPKLSKSENIHYLIRMLFSCLVDADYLDTERFMNVEEFEKRRNHDYSPKPLLEKLEAYLDSLNRTSSDTEVNRVRRIVQAHAVNNSEGNTGLYEMTVPTGGGKTLSSLLWALRHAVKNNLRRIIIAIPYTSIIEQTAQTLKRIFGDENVLEHHSQITLDNKEGGENTKSIALATENWDYPIVVTTNVRLFESLFHHKPSKCRRLHNLSKSVIILDEVQSLPIHLYNPLISALEALHAQFASSVLLTTASQPVLWGKLRGVNKFVEFRGFDKTPTPVIPHDDTLWRPLRRVDLSFDSERISYATLADRLLSHSRVLCIVNKRKTAKEIFNLLPEDKTSIHLSRMMCPAHLKRQLNKMKECLSDPNSEIRVISTQLIEAGVDVDFPVVYRQEAGLDSIIQAAGRCNREGKLPEKGKTIVFSLEEANSVPKGYLTKANDARKDMDKNTDWFSDKAMETFFLKLIHRFDTFDKYDTLNDLTQYYKFETASTRFKYIDNDDIAVIVNWGESSRLLERYRSEGPSYTLFKELSQYSVSINRQDFILLQSKGLIEDYGGIWIVTDSRAYDERVGLTIENEWLEEPLIL